MINIMENINVCDIDFDVKKQNNDNPFYKNIAIIYENKAIGYLGYFLIYDRIEIDYLYVEKKYRKKGYANILINKLVEISKKENCINITLEVNVNNNVAINLYKKNGFEIIKTIYNYYNGEDGYLMLKEM